MNVRVGRQGHFMDMLHQGDMPPWGQNPGDWDADAVRRTLDGPFGWMYGNWFRMDLRGWEHIPDGPVMVVSNHSGGTSIPDAWGFLAAWYRHFGTTRPIHPMAHEMVMSNRLTGEYFARRGALRASRLLARDVLREWRRDLMVMPGGDLETWRPYAERYHVSFGGRSGYARLALQENVPIVPVAHAGAHETLMVLSSGKRLARALRLPDLFRAEIMPIHLSLPWGLGVGPVPHFPTPALLRYRIGAPVFPPEGHEPGAPVADAVVDEVDRLVQHRIQDGLNDLAGERAVLAERVVDGLRGVRTRLATSSRRR